MLTNRAVCAESTQANSIDALHDAARPPDVATMLRAAVEGNGCPHGVAASAVGYQPDYWNRVLGCERGITLDRLGKLPLDVQRDFVAAWAEALGIKVERRGIPDGMAELVELAGLIATRRVRVTLEVK